MPKPIPEGYHSLTPHLLVDGAQTLIMFLTATFGAEETFRSTTPDGSIGHAELRIGDSMLTLADASTSETGTPRPSTVMVYVEDVDETYRRAMENGAASLRDPADQFYGDRSAGVEDPVGGHWWIHTHIEDVPPEELVRRAREVASRQLS